MIVAVYLRPDVLDGYIHVSLFATRAEAVEYFMSLPGAFKLMSGRSNQTAGAYEDLFLGFALMWPDLTGSKTHETTIWLIKRIASAAGQWSKGPRVPRHLRFRLP